MKKENQQKNKIDQVGFRLLEVTRTTDEQIEKIVANPQLFDSVRERIRAGEQTHPGPKRVFGDWSWSKLNLLKTPVVISAFAVLAVLLVWGTFIEEKDQDLTSIVSKKVESKIQPSITREENVVTKDFGNKKKPSVKSNGPKSSFHAIKANSVKNQRTVTKALKKSKPVRKTKTIKPPRVSEKREQRVFYSLNFAESKEDRGELLQIVSTELSRSELFALGLNIQLENEIPKIKAELLVGTDGIARAIRVLEK